MVGIYGSIESQTLRLDEEEDAAAQERMVVGFGAVLVLHFIKTIVLRVGTTGD